MLLRVGQPNCDPERSTQGSLDVGGLRPARYGLARRALIKTFILSLPALLVSRAAAQTGALIDDAVADDAETPEPIIADALRSWRGDLDGMVERGMIRVAIPIGLTT